MHTKISTLLLLFVLALSFTSCGDDDKPAPASDEVELVFKVEYDGEPLLMSIEDYQNPNGMNMRISRFSVFMSDFKFDDVESGDVEFINFADVNTSTSAAEKGTCIPFQVAEGGTYTNVSFTIGISVALNAMIPGDFDADHPLSQSGEYWDGWSSFVFVKTEGKIDSDGDGIFETNMALHHGSDEARKSISLTGTFNAGSSGNSEIIIDLKHLFEGDNGIYDIMGTPTIHMPNQLSQVIELSDNLVSAFSAR